MKSMTAWRWTTCCYFLPFHKGEAKISGIREPCAILCRWCVFEPESAAVETEKWRRSNDYPSSGPGRTQPMIGLWEQPWAFVHLVLWHHRHCLSSSAFYSVNPKTCWILVRQWNRSLSLTVEVTQRQSSLSVLLHRPQFLLNSFLFPRPRGHFHPLISLIKWASDRNKQMQLQQEQHLAFVLIDVFV